jgi:hypothetical protein
LRRLALTLAILATAACAPLPYREARPAKSSLGCMQAALRDRLPEQLPDSQAHCLAAGLIARYCSVTEASLASIGKEIGDLFGRGDAEWRDLQSDRRGIRCARDSRNDAGLRECCMKTTPAETR